MHASVPHDVRTLPLATAVTTILPACGTMGDTAAVKNAYELAIACKTGEALAAVDRASQGGGLSAHIGDLQRLVILRDAGRTSEADAAMTERDTRAGTDAKAAAETEQAIAKSIDQLQTERMKQTVRRTCP